MNTSNAGRSAAPEPRALLDLAAPAAVVARLAAAVPDDALGRVTPCRFPVRTLITHLLGLSVAFTDAAAKVDGPTTRTAPDPTQQELPDDWRTELPDRLSRLVAAWRQPDAWTGTTLAGGAQLPGEVMGLVANDELVLHGWDLAVAIGQPYEVAQPNLEACWQMVSTTPDGPGREGLFGPVVPVDPAAPLLDRALGAAGRDPGWTPPDATS